jgi:hypothetical protein
LLPQIEDLSFASGLRATQPRQQRRKKSWNTDHSVRSLPDWKAIDRLDKIFGSHSLGDVVLYLSFANPGGIKTLVDACQNYFLAGTALFAPYALNQIASIFQPPK